VSPQDVQIAGACNMDTDQSAVLDDAQSTVTELALHGSQTSVVEDTLSAVTGMAHRDDEVDGDQTTHVTELACHIAGACNMDTDQSAVLDDAQSTVTEPALYGHQTAIVDGTQSTIEGATQQSLLTANVSNAGQSNISHITVQDTQPAIHQSNKMVSAQPVAASFDVQPLINGKYICQIFSLLIVVNTYSY
jgi:hypothetical protein